MLEGAADVGRRSIVDPVVCIPFLHPSDGGLVMNENILQKAFGPRGRQMVERLKVLRDLLNENGLTEAIRRMAKAELSDNEIEQIMALVATEQGLTPAEEIALFIQGVSSETLEAARGLDPEHIWAKAVARGCSGSPRGKYFCCNGALAPSHTNRGLPKWSHSVTRGGPCLDVGTGIRSCPLPERLTKSRVEGPQAETSDRRP